jgi:hypothetical protein
MEKERNLPLASEKPVGEEWRPSMNHYAFHRLAPIVNTITVRRVITTNIIMPNSGICCEGVVKGKSSEWSSAKTEPS